MNILSLRNLLIPLAFQGLLWTILLLAFCFGGVVIANLARLGWEYRSEQPQSATTNETSQKTAPAEKPQEPIYYIVEKKKRRPKNGYDNAKPFHFKEH